MIGRVIAACILAWAGLNLAARLVDVEPLNLDDTPDAMLCDPGMTVTECLEALDSEED